MHGIATSGTPPGHRRDRSTRSASPTTSSSCERGDVARAKPEPGPVPRVRAPAEVEPEDCYVIGDAVWDLLAARRARMLRSACSPAATAPTSCRAPARSASTATPPSFRLRSTSSGSEPPARGRPRTASRAASGCTSPPPGGRAGTGPAVDAAARGPRRSSPPARSASSACRPSGTTSHGRISSSSRSSHGIQCAISVAFGSRFFGGRALTTFVIQTSERTSPASASSSSSSFPARPTNGRPSCVLGRAGRLADEHDARRAGSLRRGPSARPSRTARNRSRRARRSRRATQRAGRPPCRGPTLASDYGLVVDSVNVSVLLYAPVRSASLDADRLLERRSLTDVVGRPGRRGQQRASGSPSRRPARTRRRAAALVALACSGCGSENVPLTRWPVAFELGSATDSVASPAVEMTLRRRRRRVVARHARDERPRTPPACPASATASPAPCRRRAAPAVVSTGPSRRCR